MKELKFEREDVYKEVPQTEAEYLKNGKREDVSHTVLTLSCKEADLPFGNGRVLITDGVWAGILKDDPRITVVGYHVGNDWLRLKVPYGKEIKAYKL